MGKRKTFTDEQVWEMVVGWDDKTIEEWAAEFELSQSTIISTSAKIYKKDPLLCKPKEKVKTGTKIDRFFERYEKEKKKYEDSKGTKAEKEEARAFFEKEKEE